MKLGKSRVVKELPGKIDMAGARKSKLKDTDRFPVQIDREDGTSYHRVMNVKHGVFYIKYGRSNNDIEAFVIIDKRTGEVVGNYDCVVSYNGAWNSASDKIDELT